MKIFSFMNGKKEGSYKIYLNKIPGIKQRDAELLRKQMAVLDIEYGISPKSFVSDKYYLLDEKQQIKKANNRRLLGIRAAKAAEESGLTEKEIRAMYRKAHREDNVSQKEFFGKKLFLDEKLRSVKDETDAKKNSKRKYIKKIESITDWETEQILRKLNQAKLLCGISPDEYVKNRMYSMSETQMVRKHLALKSKEEKTGRLYEAIFEASGKDKDAVLEEIHILKGLAPDLSINLNRYYIYGYYNCCINSTDSSESENEILSRLEKNRILKSETNRIRDLLTKADNKEYSYEELQSELEEYTRKTGELLSELRKRELIDKIKYVLPEVENNRELAQKISLDMEVTWQILRFLPAEYVMFAFYNKSVEERMTFISSNLKREMFRQTNSQEIIDLFDNKYAAYERFREYYGRKVLLLENKNQYEEFIDFCKNNSEFVIKSNYGAMGKSVSKVSVKSMRPLKTAFEKLIEAEDVMVVEELIVPHRKIRKLNPDSVNTVRVVVYVENGIAKVQDCFMKVGRKGSFVDNGGSGGIFVHIDKDRGVFDSTGIDENGIRYICHPEQKYKFTGYKLPLWDNALKLAEEVSAKVDSTCYIGWDLTLTKDSKWIIVEGNSRTQFYGQQGTIDKGIKEELIKNVGSWKK